MASQDSSEPGVLDRRKAWIVKVRGLHRNKRMACFASIMAGSGVLLWWRLTPLSPVWAMWCGAGLLAAGWLLLIFLMIDRYRWVKANPYVE